MKPCVVVTGISLLSSLGKNKNELWQRLLQGENSFFLSPERQGHLFSDQPQSSPLLFDWISEVVAAALEDAQLKRPPELWLAALHPFLHHPIRETLHDWLSKLSKKNRSNQHPVLLQGACAAGNLALGQAVDFIRYQGYSSAIVFGGNEVHAIISKGFEALRIVSPTACAPFCIHRSGMSLGEGAVALVLEAETAAKKRGAKIYGYISGWSSALDGHSVTGFSPTAFGPTAAFWWALYDAKLNPGEIQWVCAHGTGTKQNDLAETKALKNIFKNAAYSIPVTSNKAQIGHTLEAAGLFNAAVVLNALQENIIPGTYNYQGKDPLCDLDYLPNTYRQKQLRNIASNAFGFGGVCSTVIFSKGAG